ncbi:lipoprotein [Actinoplanes sp. NBC_00393]|uniref:lipoprotein n=1 Tax=Actinoplanes sp. NBC_00393 TaxID=2975953 RepID=UPI002E24513A
MLAALTLFAGACNSGGGDAGAAPASAAADNTAEICKSGGEAARTAVIDLFSKIAGLTEIKEPARSAEFQTIYQSTFGTLRDDLSTEAGKATNKEFAAVLEGIAAEAGKLATEPNPEEAGTDEFQAALEKLEPYCPSGSPSESGAPAAPAAAGGAVGAKGSACPLPVTFTLPAEWEAKTVEVEDDNPLASLVRKGPLKLGCEIKAQPVGVIGFLRVWVAPKSAGNAKAMLKAYLKGEKFRKATYQPVKIGDRKGVEARFELYSQLEEAYEARKAFAVAAPGGVVVVELSGLEADDPAMQAGYDLVMGSVKATA